MDALRRETSGPAPERGERAFRDAPRPAPGPGEALGHSRNAAPGPAQAPGDFRNATPASEEAAGDSRNAAPSSAEVPGGSRNARPGSAEAVRDSRRSAPGPAAEGEALRSSGAASPTAAPERGPEPTPPCLPTASAAASRTSGAARPACVERIGRGPAGLPFCRLTVAKGRFRLSGQVAQDPATGRIGSPDVYGQSVAVLRSILRMLDEAGYGPEEVTRMTVFLMDMAEKEAFDRAFRQVFRRAGDRLEEVLPSTGAPPPGASRPEEGSPAPCGVACTFVGVAALPNPDALVEVEVEGFAGAGKRLF